MTKGRLKQAVGVFAAVGMLFYAALYVMNREAGIPGQPQDLMTERHRTVALFGATGTIGDGLLKAATADPGVATVRVFTRRSSPRIEAAVAAGKAQMVLHKDYLDYAAIEDQLADVDAVFWAIGLSAVGLDEQTYREIHLDYPSRFVARWLAVRGADEISFHYVSGSGAKSQSRMMWAREKARAERELAQLAAGTGLRVVSYRPAVILPTESEAHLGHRVGHAILKPVKMAVAAEAIGQAMLEVSARGEQYPNGSIIENKAIIELGEAQQQRVR